MLKKLLPICLLLTTLAGCSRDNPTSAKPEPELTTLNPLSTINLAPGITEPSGIAYNRKNNTFLVVSDSRPEIFEIDLQGHIQRTIPTTGIDLEGVSVTANGDTLFIVQERDQLVDSYSSTGTLLSSLPVKVATLPNNGLEGVAVDRDGHLWVINEKNPRLLLEFSGSREVSRREITLADDLSDICCDPSDASLWILSDESRKLLKIARDGTLLDQWALPFDKGEGITFAGDRMYIVNDLDARLYIFAKPL
jgi:uncharacterized protein YjiK